MPLHFFKKLLILIFLKGFFINKTNKKISHEGAEVKKGTKYTVRNEMMYKWLSNEEVKQ